MEVISTAGLSSHKPTLFSLNLAGKTQPQRTVNE